MMRTLEFDQKKLLYRLVLLKARLLKIELKSIVNKRLRFYKKQGVESSGDYLIGWIKNIF